MLIEDSIVSDEVETFLDRQYLTQKNNCPKEDMYLVNTAEKFKSSIKSFFKFMGYKVSDLISNEINEAVILVEKDYTKTVVLGCLFKGINTTPLSLVSTVKHKMQLNLAGDGIIITNRPSTTTTRDIAKNNEIQLIYGYNPDSIVQKTMEYLLRLDALQEAENKDWYQSVNYNFLSRYFSILRYQVKTIIMDDNTERSTDILINKKMTNRILKTGFNQTSKIKIINEVILANKYYNNLPINESSHFYKGGIVISNIDFSDSEKELADSHEIKLICVFWSIPAGNPA